MWPSPSSLTDIRPFRDRSSAEAGPPVPDPLSGAVVPPDMAATPCRLWGAALKAMGTVPLPHKAEMACEIMSSSREAISA